MPQQTSSLRSVTSPPGEARRRSPAEYSRGRRYRHLWPGLLLLTSLAVLLGSLLVWGDHFLSPGPSGGIRRLLPAWPAARNSPRVATSVPAPPPSGLEASGSDAASSGSPEVVPEPARDPAVQILAPEVKPPAASPPADPAAEERLAPRPRVRYALELGAFLLSEEADRVEARLNETGFSTVRFRQQAGATLFSVLVEGVSDADEAQAIVERLRQQGLPQATVLGGWQGLSIRVGETTPLRTAVATAEKLRALGYPVRVAAQSGRVTQITLRHGNFASRREADLVSREIASFGLPNEVVRVK